MIKRLSRTKLENQEIDKIISLYKDGYSSNYLAKIFLISNGTIFNYLKLKNIKSRSRKEFSRNYKKYNFDIKFFDVETQQLAYFYGFCLGDGNVGLNKGNSYLRIRLNKKDRIILETFLKWMNGDEGMIKDRGNTSELRINNSFFKNDLSQWGLVKNKTYEPVIPNIKSKYLKSFIIGLLDADGSIKFNNKDHRINLVGNKKIMRWFVSSIRKLGFNGKITIYDKYSDVWDRVHINIKNDVIELANILNVENNFHLERKWHNLLKFLERTGY